MHRLTESDFRLASHFQDGDDNVISRRKVLPLRCCQTDASCAQTKLLSGTLYSSVQQFLDLVLVVVEQRSMLIEAGRFSVRK